MLIDSFSVSKGWVRQLFQLKKFKSSVSNLLLSSVLVNTLSMALPLIMMQVYDRILINKASSTLIWLVIGCCTALIFETILRLARSFTSGWMGSRMEHLFGVSAVEKVLSSKLEDFEKHEIGVHLDRINAVSTIRAFYSGQVFQVWMDLPFSLLYLIAIYYLSNTLVLLPLFLIFSFLLIAFFLKKKFEAHRENQVSSNDDRYNFIIEVLREIHLIKSSTVEEQMLRRYETLQAKSADINMAVCVWNMLPGNISVFFSQLTMFGMICVGASYVINGHLTLGGLTACTMLSGRAFQPIQSAAGLWVRFSEAKIAKKQLRHIANLKMEVAKDTPEFPDTLSGSITLDQISYQAQKNSPLLLDNVSLKILPGQFIGITGEDPIASTVLLNCIIGSIQPQSGSVLIDNYNIFNWKHSDLRGKIEILPATGTLFKGTILDNISLFDPNKQPLALDTASLVGLDTLIADLPLGYETQVGAEANKILPNGLIQRICIARALMQRPRILLCNRTCSSLDEESEQLYSSLLGMLKGHCTLIVVSNKSTILKKSDKIFDIKDGQLKENIELLKYINF